MTAIRRSCLILLAGAWAGVLLRSGYTASMMVGGWMQQNPRGNPKYLKLAHYAVSTQTEGRTVYDTVVDLTNVATQIVAGVNYNLTFTTAPSNCTIGKVNYSAELCSPAGTVNGKCSATVYDIPWMNITTVTSYTCSNATN